MIRLEMACFLILNSNFLFIFLYYYFEPYVKHSTFEIFPLHETSDWYLWKLVFMSIHLFKELLEISQAQVIVLSDLIMLNAELEYFAIRGWLITYLFIYKYIYIFEFSFYIWRIRIRNVACLKFCYALVNKSVL